TREGWVKLEGEPRQLDQAQRVFEQLEQARQKGVDIHKHEFSYALNSVTEERPDSLNDVVDFKILTSSRKAPIMARTLGQRNYVDAIQKNDIVFGVGPAGTGKTYLAVAMAVAALKKEQVNRIILTRPAVEAGEALGFLPGDLQEKITPYLRPLYDALRDMLEAEEIERSVARQTIEVAPLAYMRGRTLSNAFVILDEAQNTTTEQMFMLLTRMGPNSKCVVTGDVTQIDLPIWTVCATGLLYFLLAAFIFRIVVLLLCVEYLGRSKTFVIALLFFCPAVSRLWSSMPTTFLRRARLLLVSCVIFVQLAAT